MSKKQTAKPKPRKPRREYGPSYFFEKMHGLAQAAQKVAAEEQLMLKFDPNGKRVN